MAKTLARLAVLASTALAVAQLADGSSSFAASIPRPVESGACLADIERSVVELFERVSPSVTQIAAFTSVDDPAGFESRIGSGFIWDTAGNIVTNEHVVRGARTIAVWLASGERAEAEIVGTAPNYDLAVIRLKDARTLPPPLPVGSSSGLKVGQFAYAVGSHSGSTNLSPRE